MVATLDKILLVTWKVLRAVLVVLLTVMVVILCAHIFCRYVLNDSLTWSEECLKAMLVWFGMLSVAVLAIRREHVSIVVFKNMMPEKLRKFWDKFVQCLIVVICVLVTIVGIRYTLAAGTRCTPAMGIPYFYLYSAIPVSFFLVTLYEIRNLLVDFTKQGTYELVKKPEEDLTGGTAVELE